MAELKEIIRQQGALLGEMGKRIEMLEHPKTPPLYVKRLSPDAKLPTRGTPRSGGLDLYATEDLEIGSGAVACIRTQLAVEIPEGHGGLLMTRSSFGKNMVLIAAGANLIDEDFRGHLLVYLMNVGEYSWKIRKGDRVAQLAIVPIEYCEALDVGDGELSETQRGTGGFGSTGR